MIDMRYLLERVRKIASELKENVYTNKLDITQYKYKEGNFLGQLVSTNKKNNTETYELKLPTDPTFAKVHGDIKLYYVVYKDIKTGMLDRLVPEDILSEGHQSELITYKGVMVSKEHSDKDIFKINLLGLLDNNK